VGIDDGSLQADSQPKSVGLVGRLAAAWRSVCIHRMNRVNSRSGLAMMTDSTINIGIIITIIIEEQSSHNSVANYYQFIGQTRRTC